MRYKVLTLTQPYATLVAIGAKKIETRSWSTSHRGALLIHAGKGPGDFGTEAGLWDCALSEPFRTALAAAGIMNPARLPRGKIVARCEVVDCVETWPSWATVEPWFTGARGGVGRHYYEVPPPAGSHERAFGGYDPGRYAWLLADVQPLAAPIAARGLPGLWDWDGEIPEIISGLSTGA